MPDCIVIGGSRGIGLAIAESMRAISYDVTATSRSQVDTSDLDSVRGFAGRNPETDVLVLNTGGPPPKEFDDVTEPDWQKYHNQLFLGFCILLREIKVRDGGYVFLISSGVIKEPAPGLVISSAYRAAFSTVLKVQSRTLAARNVSCINIAPGPIDTDRIREIIPDMGEFRKTLPMGRLGEPSEIGDLVGCIVQNNIRYLSGAVIDFDGARSSHVY